MDGISFPISWRGIDRFERQNDIFRECFGIGWERNHNFEKNSGKEGNHVISFQAKTGENEHFALVNNINRLWFGQDSKNKKPKASLRGLFKLIQLQRNFGSSPRILHG